MSRRQPHYNRNINIRQILFGFGSTLSILLWGASLAYAQSFAGNPPALKWRQLKTDFIHIVFPKGQDSAALKIAALIRRLRSYPDYSLGGRLENPPIVLQTETTMSNGYVGLGPYRSEFYLTSPMDVLNLGSIDWASTLALHEYRHIMQYDNLNTGLTGVMDSWLGDNARSLFSDMAVPNWFFEGDAVYSETLHSTEGRGRLPRFMNIYPVLKKDGKTFNYQKLRNGSFKDYIPGHYNLGYILVDYGYRTYGQDFWGKVIRDAAGYKGLFYPFQKAVQRQSGVSFKQFREQAFKAYQETFDSLNWKDIDSSKTVFSLSTSKLTSKDGPILPLTRGKTNEVVDYQYPYPYDGPDSSEQRPATPGIIALKTPSVSLSHFVMIQNGKETDIGEAPIARDGYFGYHHPYIIYTRYQVDPRWSYKEYSDLEILNIQTGKRHTVTRKSRYFTPDIIETGRGRASAVASGAHNQISSEVLITAARLTTGGQSSVDLLDKNGKLLQRLVAPPGYIYNYPKFFRLADGGAAAKKEAERKLGLLFVIRTPDGRMGIDYATVVSDKNKPSLSSVKPLVPLNSQLIAYPVVRDGLLFYTRVDPGRNDPYTALLQIDLGAASSMEKRTGGKEVVRPGLSAQFVRDGYQGFVNENGQLVISLQTAMGYGLFAAHAAADSTVFNRNNHERSNGRPPVSVFKGYLPLQDIDGTEVFSGVIAGRSDRDQDQDQDTLHKHLQSATAPSNLQVRQHLTNVIKKYPLLSHPFHFHSLQPAIEDPEYSLKLLGQNTLNTVQTTLSYNYNRVTRISSAGADLSLGLWYLEPFIQMDYSWNHLAADSKGNQYAYQELTSQLGVQLPLNFTGGRWSRSLYMSTALSQSNLYWSEPAFQPGSALTRIRYLFSRIQYSMTARQAIRQIYPRWGLYTYTEFNSPLDGKGPRQWMNSNTIYLPGILPTHSFKWTLAYQNRDTAGAYGYSSRFPFSRGYTRPSFATMWKFGLDYDLPVCYPDFGFASMAYFSRIRAGLYFDQSYGFDNQNRRSAYGSVGATAYADMNIGNQYPITIGLRYNYLLNKNYPFKSNWEFILPIHIF